MDGITVKKSPKRLIDIIYEIDFRNGKRQDYALALEKMYAMQAEVEEAIKLADLRIIQFDMGTRK